MSTLLQAQLDRRLAAPDVRRESRMELGDRLPGQVDGHRELQVVELPEVLAERWVDLGLGRLGLDDEAVADAALLGERHGQQEQR
jgi:hypothetical protein